MHEKSNELGPLLYNKHKNIKFYYKKRYINTDFLDSMISKTYPLTPFFSIMYYKAAIFLLLGNGQADFWSFDILKNPQVSADEGLEEKD